MNHVPYPVSFAISSARSFPSDTSYQKTNGDERQLYEQRRQQENAEAAVESNLFRIVKLVNDKDASYFPPVDISSSTSITFEFEVSVPTQAARGGAKSWFKNVLNTGPERFLAF